MSDVGVRGHIRLRLPNTGFPQNQISFRSQGYGHLASANNQLRANRLYSGRSVRNIEKDSPVEEYEVGAQVRQLVDFRLEFLVRIRCRKVPAGTFTTDRPKEDFNGEARTSHLSSFEPLAKSGSSAVSASGCPCKYRRITQAPWRQATIPTPTNVSIALICHGIQKDRTTCQEQSLASAG